MKAPISDYTVDNDKFWGIYRGVVEDRYDPEMLGRCRIRVLGVHDQQLVKDDLNGIPTKELPWAEPCYGLFEGSVSGNGSWSVPLQGSYVFVFFENGNWMQIRYFLSAPGMPELPPNPAEGFNDPAAKWPDGDWLKESDVHRLAKVDKLDKTTLKIVKAPSVDKGVAVAIGGTWDEQNPMYQAKYPFNNVVYNHSGIYTEMDNTEGNRRYHIYHPSNSYLEIGETGKMVLRNNDDRWDITVKNKMEHVIESHHRCVNMERTSKVMASETEQVDVNHYKDIGILCRETVNVIRWHEVKVADLQYDPILKGKEIGVMDFKYAGMFELAYTGIYHIHWNNMFNDKYTQLIDREIVGLNKIKQIRNDEDIKVGNNRSSWVQITDHQKSGDTIWIHAATQIILEAPYIEFRGEDFNDLCVNTNIAGVLTWNGVALGCAEYAGTAPLKGPVEVYEVDAIQAEPPVEPPDTPMPMKPSDPPGPPSIPPPTPPPAPDVYAYVDVPPKPDVCE